MEPVRLPDPQQPYFLTGGDPAGIAPEIIPDAIGRYLEIAPEAPLVYLATAGGSHLSILQERAGKKNIRVVSLDTLEDALKETRDSNQTCVYYISVSEMIAPDSSNRAGEPNYGTGLLALEALRLACELIQQIGTSGLCTAPLAKNWVDQAIKKTRQSNLHFSGHTGFLAETFQSDVIMLMHGQKFSVIPLTVHIALADVPKNLKQVLKDPSLTRLLRLLQRMPVFRQKSWAMCALNPHCGEEGLFGKEELEYLNDWCKKQRTQNLPLQGPFSADTLFSSDVLKDHRLVLSCYHDQGLIPFKSLEGQAGVNCTIGLPFLRSSPDHGTAFNIAGKNIARSGSMVRAMEVLLNRELMPEEL